MKTIDVTGDRFDYVDGMDGKMSFGSFQQGEEFKLYIHGLSFSKDLVESAEDTFIDSETEICFEDTQGILVEYWSSPELIDTAHFPFGSGKWDLRLGKLDVDGSRDYMIGAGMKGLPGFCDISIFCRGRVRITYDENSMLSIKDFTDKYIKR